MGLGQWMRVLDTVGGLVQLAADRFKPPPTDLSAAPPGGGPLGQLEARLAGVVVAALKEAFDRDRARMDLERSHMDAERQRAEAALRAELRRQAAERALGQVRFIAAMAFVLLMVSAVLLVLLPGMREAWPRMMVGSGWLLAIAALGCAFAAWRHVSSWSVAPAPAADAAVTVADTSTPAHTAANAALWLLLLSLGLTLGSLLAAL